MVIKLLAWESNYRLQSLEYWLQTYKIIDLSKFFTFFMLKFFIYEKCITMKPTSQHYWLYNSPHEEGLAHDWQYQYLKILAIIINLT